MKQTITNPNAAREAGQLEPVTATAPSAWASYLINGDASGIDATEREQADGWIARQGVGAPVSCEDAGFIRSHDAVRECPLAADCQTYTFLVRSTPAADAMQSARPLTLREKLITHVGSDVTIENVAHSIGTDCEGQVDFCFNGQLEGPDTEDGTFYVRVKECYNGCSGIRFGVVNLDREFPIEKQPSGRIVITLK